MWNKVGGSGNYKKKSLVAKAEREDVTL